MGGRIIEGRIILHVDLAFAGRAGAVFMLVLPFIMYGVTKRVTAVTKGVTAGAGDAFFNRSKRRKRRKPKRLGRGGFGRERTRKSVCVCRVMPSLHRSSNESQDVTRAVV